MNIDFDKCDGLVPAIIQDAETGKVLMLGYMNREAYEKTRETQKVTFFSRSRQELWTKGETSDNYLILKELRVDCDGDTLLVKAQPAGPTCHTGEDTCFGEINESLKPFLWELERIIIDRKTNPKPGSYTNKLFMKGVKKIAQKLGEEATEVIIDALADDIPQIKEETADLLYHLLVLLAEKQISLDDIMGVLKQRRK